jgi:hypothetical protein
VGVPTLSYVLATVKKYQVLNGVGYIVRGLIVRLHAGRLEYFLSETKYVVKSGAVRISKPAKYFVLTELVL